MAASRSCTIETQQNSPPHRQFQHPDLDAPKALFKGFPNIPYPPPTPYRTLSGHIPSNNDINPEKRSVFAHLPCPQEICVPMDFLGGYCTCL